PAPRVALFREEPVSKGKEQGDAAHGARAAVYEGRAGARHRDAAVGSEGDRAARSDAAGAARRAGHSIRGTRQRRAAARAAAEGYPGALPGARLLLSWLQRGAGAPDRSRRRLVPDAVDL